MASCSRVALLCGALVLAALHEEVIRGVEGILHAPPYGDDNEGYSHHGYPPHKPYVFNSPRYGIRARRAEVQERHSNIHAPQNGDRSLTVKRNGVSYSIAVFCKTLVHNEYGEVPTEDFKKLEKAMATGLQKDFDAIKRSPLAKRKLADPQAALAVGFSGPDSFSIPFPPSPTFQSAETSYEMILLYGLSLIRDVPFFELESGHSGAAYILKDLLHDLNKSPELFGGRLDYHGRVTLRNLNRGPNEGASIGPVVSQFLIHDFNYGNIRFRQDIGVEEDKPISVDVQGWLAIQRGIVTATPTPLYPTIRACNWRALGSYVHNDPPCSSYVNAALILNQFGAPLSPAIPMLKNEGTFVTFGIADVISAINDVCGVAFKTSWRQKWNVNLRLRPELMGGRIHFTEAHGVQYGINPAVLKSRTLRNARLYNKNVLGHDTYLLAQMFTEGSPTHPAYPAAHAVISGAAGTILKAFFDDSALMSTFKNAAGSPFEVIESRTCEETYEELLAHPIRDPKVLDRMTVGGEVDKMSYNIATARDAAGVHYASDSNRGLILGEKVAIRYLSDRAVTYNENFHGFMFKQFNGEVVTVKAVNHKWPAPHQPTYAKSHARY